VDGRNKSGHDDGTFLVSRKPSLAYPTRGEIFFIIFVDAIFTTLFERLFTNLFDETRANTAIACVYRECNAD
jgi:hypothetical protein